MSKLNFRSKFIMKNYDIRVYDYIEKATGVHIVKAVTTYEGKAIYAFAKCSPEDKFDLEFGVKLAVLRLDKKLAKKRYALRKAHLGCLKENLEWINQDKRKLVKLIEKEEVICADRRVELYNAEVELKNLLAGF
jgi:hypothetical protein